MGVIELNGIFRAKNKTAAQWESENPILRDGELGHEKDTHKSKIGDGVTAWSGLPYEGNSKLGTPEIISNFSVSDIMDAASDLAIGEMKVWHTYNDGTPIPDAPANYPLGGTLQRVETIPNGGEDSVIITAYGIGSSNKQLAFIRTVNDNEDTGWKEIGNIASASALTDAVVITGTIKDFDFGFEKAGDMKPLKITRTAVGLPDTSFDFYGWAQCQYWNSATQYNVSLYIIQATTSKPRIFTAMYAKGYTPSWVELGKEPESGWLMQGDYSLIANSDRSFTLSNYVQRSGDKLWIEFAYLGDAADGHMIGFSQGQSIIINPAETLNTDFYSLVTSGGSAKQYTVSFRFRVSGSVLYIYASNESTDGRDIVSQFRIKGVRVLRK